VTLFQRYKRLNIWNKLGVIASVLTVITFVAWLIPERPKPDPHFTFKLQMDDAPLSDRVELNNSFLVYTDFGKVHGVLEFLFVPIQSGKSNAEFKFFVKNNSEIAAENIEVAIFVPKTAQCIPDPAWSKVAPDWIFSDTEKIGTIETNEMESFGYRVPNGLLPKDGTELPPIKLSPAQLPLAIPQMPQAVIVEARAKDWSNTAIDFDLCFLPYSIFKTNDFHKPFVLSKTELKTMQLSPEILKELQK
jgi:hypothetical protein